MGSHCIRWLASYIQVVVFKMWGSAYQIAGIDSSLCTLPRIHVFHLRTCLVSCTIALINQADFSSPTSLRPIRQDQTGVVAQGTK